MEKYYFNYDKKSGRCLESCPIGIGFFGIVAGIGSGICQECDHCESFSEDEFWIVCKYCKPKDKK